MYKKLNDINYTFSPYAAFWINDTIPVWGLRLDICSKLIRSRKDRHLLCRYG